MCGNRVNKFKFIELNTKTEYRKVDGLFFISFSKKGGQTKWQNRKPLNSSEPKRNWPILSFVIPVGHKILYSSPSNFIVTSSVPPLFENIIFTVSARFS